MDLGRGREKKQWQMLMQNEVEAKRWEMKVWRQFQVCPDSTNSVCHPGQDFSPHETPTPQHRAMPHYIPHVGRCLLTPLWASSSVRHYPLVHALPKISSSPQHFIHQNLILSLPENVYIKLQFGFWKGLASSLSSSASWQIEELAVGSLQQQGCRKEGRGGARNQEVFLLHVPLKFHLIMVRSKGSMNKAEAVP